MINLQEIKQSIIQKNKFWIAFTGDSITSTEWVHPNWREIVEYVLKEEMISVCDNDWKIPSWGIRAFNFGYDGSTTRDIKDRIPMILSHKPDVIIGLMGGNDPTFSVSVEESVENIKAIIRDVTASGAKFVWATSTPAGKASHKNEEYEPYAKAC